MAKKIIKKLPTIIVKQTDLRSPTIEKVKIKPRFSMEEEKFKKMKMKQSIMENKAQRREEARLGKESNRLLRENFMILKDIIL